MGCVMENMRFRSLYFILALDELDSWEMGWTFNGN